MAPDARSRLALAIVVQMAQGNKRASEFAMAAGPVSRARTKTGPSELPA